MEAVAVDVIPAGGEWQYEPKWDGFRCLVFRDGEQVSLWSKAGKPLTRYFPEVADAVRGVRARRFVLDGEVVVPAGRGFSFDALLQRIHPAESRIRRLAAETPARLVVFDLLVDERGARVLDLPLAKRRARLEAFARRFPPGRKGLTLSPATRDVRVARRWLAGAGPRLDGVVAKRLALPYRAGLRDGMAKVKRMRTADCVVGGFRTARGGGPVASLLLGLYDDDGLLHHVGFASNVPREARAAWTSALRAIEEPPGFTGRAPGGPSRWAAMRPPEEWRPVRPEIVVEVRYDHWSDERFRHGTSLLRRRPDKAPRQCTFDQVRPRRRRARARVPARA